MKFLFDLLPVILFFAAYKFAGADPDASLALASSFLGDGIELSQAPILIATVVAIVATMLQILIVWLKHRKVERMLWVSLVIIVVFGGATLFFHNPTFIKWKPTALYWLFSSALVAVLATVLTFGSSGSAEAHSKHNRHHAHHGHQHVHHDDRHARR